MEDNSDTDSIASYEEIHSRRQDQGQQEGIGAFKLKEERNIERLRNLVLGDKETNTELPEGEVPDICYVLQYKGLGGRLHDGKPIFKLQSSYPKVHLLTFTLQSVAAGTR